MKNICAYKKKKKLNVFLKSRGFHPSCQNRGASALRGFCPRTYGNTAAKIQKSKPNALPAIFRFTKRSQIKIKRKRQSIKSITVKARLGNSNG